MAYNGPGSNDNEEVVHFPQISKTGASLSEGLVSYPGYLFKVGGAYPSVEIQSAYYIAPADWANKSNNHFYINMPGVFLRIMYIYYSLIICRSFDIYISQIAYPFGRYTTTRFVHSFRFFQWGIKYYVCIPF